MIVSHRHQFIFLKTRKTAGTSVEIALSRHCGPDDIITPLSPEDEELRASLGVAGAQNYQSSPDEPAAYNHMPAPRVRRLVGPRVWRSYFKFAVERNPWDLLVSSYFYRYRDKRPVAFTEFVNSTRIDKMRRNADIYRLCGEIAVDKVCLYESLVEDLEAVWKQLRLPEPVDLPRAKCGFRKETDHRKMYSPEDAERVRSLFAYSVRDFGYEF
jgi:Sulfotransferase family